MTNAIPQNPDGMDYEDCSWHGIPLIYDFKYLSHFPNLEFWNINIIKIYEVSFNPHKYKDKINSLIELTKFKLDIM
jgi:hypothetical protein